MPLGGLRLRSRLRNLTNNLLFLPTELVVQEETPMELILIIVILVLLFGGGGYWGRRRGHW